MLSQTLFLLGCHALLQAKLTNAEVTLANFTEEETHYCNQVPEQYAISPLSRNDSARVVQLNQVQAFFRHGARVSISARLTDLFPGITSNVSYNCSAVRTITRRRVHDSTTLTGEKVYTDGEQVLSGDCQEGQSRAKLYSQHQVNGEHLRAAYASQLWGNMTDRKGTWASIRSAILNGAGRKQREQRIRVISTDTERTTASAIALVQALFDIDASALAKNPSAYVRLQTHATSYDPWRAYDFGDFERYFFDGAEADSPELQEYVASDFYVDTARQWKEETGSNVTLDFGGLQVMQPLCAGLALPISKQLLLDVYRASEEYQSRIFSNSGRFAARMTALEMGPLALHILGFIDAKLQSSQQQAQQVDDLVLHSFHDTSVMFLLQGLRLDWNGRFPMFAELVVLEIYTLADGSNATSGLYDDKVFRWLRNGEWLPATYPGCVAEYEDFDTQLCPLGVLIDHLESIALTMPEYAAQVAKLTATDGSSCPPGPKHKQRAKADLSLLVFFFGVVVGLQVAAFAWCMAKQGRDGECCQQASHWVRRNNPRNQHTYLYDSYEEGTRDDGDLSSFESENGNMISNLSDKDL